MSPAGRPLKEKTFVELTGTRPDIGAYPPEESLKDRISKTKGDESNIKRICFFRRKLKA
jgi:hypothetical protein